MKCLWEKTKTMKLKEILTCFKSLRVWDETVLGSQKNKQRNKSRNLLTTRKMFLKIVKRNLFTVAKL